MSTDYGASLEVGYRIPIRVIAKKTRMWVEEKYHMEPRFDKKTGNKLPDVKVVDVHAHWVYMWGEKEFQYPEDVCTAIAEDVGATLSKYGRRDGLEHYVYAVFGVNIPTRDADADGYGHLDTCGSMLVSDLAKSRKEHKAIHDKLKMRGFKPGRLRVFVGWDVS